MAKNNSAPHSRPLTSARDSENKSEDVLAGAKQLKLAAIEGIELAECHRLRAHLGISYSKRKFFTRERLRHYMHWANRHFLSLGVIIPDDMELHNLHVFKKLSVEDARQASRRVGEEMASACRRAATAVGTRCEILMVSDLLSVRACAELRDRVSQSIDTCPSFAADVDATLLNNMQPAFQRYGIPLNDSGIRATLRTYLCIEIAVFLYISHVHSPAFRAAIFSHEPPDLFRSLYTANYANSFTHITGGRCPVFLHLEPSQDNLSPTESRT